ncbi:MAG: TlyA family RNA methyltransferase [Lachnospiraceae bacterium]|nr:TlyA family RNA methyltransferase [Lachnospiraceae bacterium]
MKERLDVLLVNKGLASSREKAKALIMSGIVYVDSQKEDKAGSLFDPESNIEVRGETLKYVSRGGLKLDKAVTVFDLNFDDLICLDIGASTGGFTDCMLQNGAVKVYSVDVGHGQLDWKLRNDERVVCMEKCNFRYVTDKEIPEKIDFAATDVSFISLTKILIPAYNLLKDESLMVCLIKPQFETTREKVGKKGVVRDKNVHEEVIKKVYAFCRLIGFSVEGLDYSPIKGPEGNIEYLLLIKKSGEEYVDPEVSNSFKENEEVSKLSADDIEMIRSAVSGSHEKLETVQG